MLPCHPASKLGFVAKGMTKLSSRLPVKANSNCLHSFIMKQRSKIQRLTWKEIGTLEVAQHDLPPLTTPSLRSRAMATVCRQHRTTYHTLKRNQHLSGTMSSSSPDTGKRFLSRSQIRSAHQLSPSTEQRPVFLPLPLHPEHLRFAQRNR